MQQGKFITLEGVDGAGKSTHVEWLAGKLASRGVTITVTREPGGTPLGEKLRELVLADPMHIDTEALLMFAARREHLARVIMPALNRGDWVLSDRFTDATFAYQGAGRGMPLDRIAALERWVHPGLQPDLTLVFHVSVDVAEARRERRSDGAKDKFEQLDRDFFNRVSSLYLERARANPQRMRVIDASRSIPDIQKELEEIILSI